MPWPNFTRTTLLPFVKKIAPPSLLAGVNQPRPLPGLAMDAVTVAILAKFFHFQAIRIVFLVLDRRIVALLAIRASQSDRDAHVKHLLT